MHQFMGGATVGQWGQLAPTEIRLWGKTMLLPPLKFGEHAVNDMNRKFCPHWRKAVAPPLHQLLNCAIFVSVNAGAPSSL